MKKGIFLLTSFVMILISNITMSQCMDEKLKASCSSLLNSYIFVKSFKVNTGSTEYSYVFSRGTNYVITVCDEAEANNKMVVELYDRAHKLVASSFDKKTGKQYAKIGYQCSATGVYYMKYSFKGGKPSCGVSVLGFKRN